MSRPSVEPADSGATLPPAPVAIEYSAETMEAIRTAVVDGLYKLAKGGLEVGGLLLGEREGGTVRILATRPVRCEHAFGPTFRLSPNDEAALNAQVSAIHAEAPSTELTLVGWYRSSTRGGLKLTERDRLLWDHYCPELWQVALLLHPERLQPTRAGFFVRHAGGRRDDELPCNVFELAPLLKPFQPLSAPAAPPLPDPPPSELDAGRPIAIAGEPVPVPVCEPAPAERRVRFWLLFALAWCIAAASLAFGLREYWLPAPVPPLTLRVSDLAGQLLVQWDPTGAPVRQALAGRLEFTDGGARRAFQLDGPQARGGSFTYVRASGDVAVHLQLALPRGQSAEGVARIAVPSLPTPATAVAAEPPPDPTPPSSAPLSQAGRSGNTTKKAVRKRVRKAS